MATVTVNNTPMSTMPYAQELADIPALQVQNASLHDEYVNLTAGSLSITTDVPLFINSGTGNDTIIDNSKTPGDVVIDPGGGTNTIQASSNPTSHDTIIVDAESDAPLTDVIAGLKAGDDVVIKGLTTLPNDLANTAFGPLQGLMLTTQVPAGPAAQIFLSGYGIADLAPGGRLSATPFTPATSTASPYLLLHVAG